MLQHQNDFRKGACLNSMEYRATKTEVVKAQICACDSFGRWPFTVDTLNPNGKIYTFPKAVPMLQYSVGILYMTGYTCIRTGAADI